MWSMGDVSSGIRQMTSLSQGGILCGEMSEYNLERGIVSGVVPKMEMTMQTQQRDGTPHPTRSLQERWFLLLAVGVPWRRQLGGL
jgi:hypothetical protein